MPRRYQNQELKVTIDVTKAAEKNIAKLPRKSFLTDLSQFMKDVGSDYAYVGAQGQQIRVNLVWPPETPHQTRQHS
ncbi:hypothetical protein GWN63_04510 [Candidatus Bathyarchaeota archaeon]|nr:hypothetical protein [Candidatus Bathyarchaeota archaeon]NIR15000.1 hypothetical protein [Desulfobacterales bacterium]NIU81490.1 hypothetical protein [Candidatus Bathyarchaeota archaeon]NIV67557.1 hypothetical protein [Candidatus Bathyarchaeota archaeon]NIW34644.1 hypothetical protein [Candidatus Bathyarchaeota archaeon]